MAEPSDMILPMLREMRAEMGARFNQMDARFDTMDRRLEAIEAAQKSFKQALTADSLLSKLVTGEFEQRIAALEGRMRQLEERQ